MFITIDGPNGSGKSTLVVSLAACLGKRGVDVLATQEPTRGCLGEFLRNSEDRLTGLPLACAVAADRYHHLEHEIGPALDRGQVVLCDRYVESSFVLQAMDGVEVDAIWALNQYAAIPDLSVNLVAQPEVLRDRLESRARLTRFEQEDRSAEEVELYERARDFLSDRGYKFVVLESDQSAIEVNAEDLCHRVLGMLQRPV